MDHLTLFLPCAGGVEALLADEVARRLPGARPQTARGGVWLEGSWRDALALNLHSRLAQRVLVRLAEQPYRHEQDVYAAAHAIAWEAWFTPRQTLKVEVTASNCPLKSLNFAALRVKDAACDRLRERLGERPSVDTARPDVRLFLHLGAERLALYIDTSGEPLFKRGWREDKGDAPLKETLAAAMLAAIGWDGLPDARTGEPVPLYDPCCGSGTVLIEAAQIALDIPAGGQRRFGFERLLPFQPHVWRTMREQALTAARPWPAGARPFIFGSDVAFRMVDFARRNAERAGVAAAIDLRGGDALQRLPPVARAGVLLLNPPYGERLAAAGSQGQKAAVRAQSRAQSLVASPQGEAAAPMESAAFFGQLAAHWKRHYGGWTAWLLSPDRGLPAQLRLKATRRIPLWNGPIECRLWRFDLTGLTPAPASGAPEPAPAPAAGE